LRVSGFGSKVSTSEFPAAPARARRERECVRESERVCVRESESVCVSVCERVKECVLDRSPV